MVSSDSGLPDPKAEEPAATGGASSFDEFAADLARRDLRGFSPGPEPAPEPPGVRYEFKFPTEAAAAVHLLKIVVGIIMNAHQLPATDRIAWEYAFEFSGVPCQLRWGKWGLRLSLWLADSDQSQADEIGRNVEKRLIRAATSLHRLITPLVRNELAANRVTLVNQYTRFRGMVDYFTQLLHADRAAEPQATSRPDEDTPLPEIARVLRQVQADFQHHRERGYLATALLSGYFAYIQHVLVLLSAFSPRALESGFTVEELMKAEWREQFNAAFPPPHEPRLNGAKTDLSHLASSYRNPLLHGGGRVPADGIFVQFAPGHFILATEDGELSNQFMLWQPALSPEQIDDILERVHRIDEAIERHPYFPWVRSGLEANFHRDAVRRALQAIEDGNVAAYTEAADIAYDDAINWDGGGWR